MLDERSIDPRIETCTVEELRPGDIIVALSINRVYMIISVIEHSSDNDMIKITYMSNMHPITEHWTHRSYTTSRLLSG